MEETHYYPFGLTMAGISSKALEFGNPENKKKYQQYEFNSDFDINLYESFYRTHDPQIGRFLQIDPKPDYSVSLYAAMNNNPIKFSDFLGDSSIIDKNGYVLHYDPKDKDLRVFMQDGKKMEQVGELGGKIKAGKWFKNLLKKNSKTADGIWNPATFYNYVKKGGRWDYKNLNQSNERVRSGELKEHILGIAFYRKDAETNPNADLGDTQFSFGDANARAEDLNNFHFGVTGKATGLFPEATLLQFAGMAEVLKYAEQGKTVPEGWNPVKQTPRGPILFLPYGDNPIDHQWIKNGFKYYRENRRDLDGDWW